MKLITVLLLAAGAVVAQPKLPRLAPRLNILDACRGKITIAAFIVTSCPHCRAFTHNVMEPLEEAKQVCALAIAFDEDADTARFATEQRLTFPVFRLDRKTVRGFLGMTGEDRVIGTPQVVMIDKTGMIQAQSAPEGSPLLLQPAVVREIVQKMERRQ